MQIKENDYPLISILIPCYNHEKYLDDCINSILDQDYPCIELLVCDDSSTDNSWKKINYLHDIHQDRFHDFIIFKNERNMGITRTLNILLGKANGEYVKTIASDDMLNRACISKFVNIAKNYLDKSIFVCNGVYIDEDTHYPNDINKPLYYTERPDFDSDHLFERLYNNNFVFAPGVFVRKSLYDKFGYYDENIFIEDWEYWLRISLLDSKQFYYIDEKLVFYRVNSNSITSLINNAQMEKRRLLIYKAEVSLIDKYGANLKNKKMYANKKLKRIEDELIISYRNDLKALKKKLYKDILKFDMWTVVGITRILKIILLILILKINKNYNFKV